MNKYIKHNQRLAEKRKQEIEDGNATWHCAMESFVCVECGIQATYPNFCFFNKDPKRVKCYECQMKD